MKKVFKNSFLLALIMLTSLCSNAQIRQLSWYDPSPILGGYKTTDFGVCGSPILRQFKVAYDHCPELIGVDCITGCGIGNHIRYTVTLYRDNVSISSQTYTASSDWSNTLFYNVSTPPGVYKAYVLVERKKGICIGWETVSQGWTNSIAGTDIAAVPNFNVDGTTIPANGDPINTCISDIRINAAGTSCETSYFISVEESDRWWNRTYDYEFGLWFSGQAPNNINLQNLASTYSVPPYFTGSASRQGDVLIGGNLPSGAERYYRIHVCTGEPTWQCKSALIKVNNNCKMDLSSIIEDTNEYIVWENETDNFSSLDNNIKSSFEAKQASDITELNNFSEAAITLYPNPFSTTTTVRIDNYEGQEPIYFELYNTLGEQVQNIKSTSKQFDIQRNNLPSGIYLYRISANNEVIGGGKLVIE